MSRTTATIETLTAEVRVLMVGNRQVTAGVYRQLDDVPNGAEQDFTAFGRVNLDCATHSSCPEWCVQLVGRLESTGDLMRCHLWRYADDHPMQVEAFEKLKALPVIVLASMR